MLEPFSLTFKNFMIVTYHFIYLQDEIPFLVSSLVGSGNVLT